MLKCPRVSVRYLNDNINNDSTMTTLTIWSILIQRMRYDLERTFSILHCRLPQGLSVSRSTDSAASDGFHYDNISYNGRGNYL